MSMFTKAEDNRRFISILSDGRFHEKVNEGVEGAILRSYETSDGKQGSKWEMVYSKIQAHITAVSFEEGDYGEQLLVTIQGEEGEAVIATATKSNFAQDIMSKLPNIDFEKIVEFSPYAFEDNGKKKKGVTLLQDEQKVQGFFRKQVDNKWVSEHGFPEVKDMSVMTSQKWELYFLNVAEFLATYTKENICPKINNKRSDSPVEEEKPGTNPQKIDDAFDAAFPDKAPF